MLSLQQQVDWDSLAHVLCGLILLGRLGDIISTWLITPKLDLEANPIVRRLGWRFAVLTVLICLVPYVVDVWIAVILVQGLDQASVGRSLHRASTTTDST